MAARGIANRCGWALLCLYMAGACNALAGSPLPEITVVVSASNPLRALERHEIEAIFLGHTDRFPDGSPAVPIDQTSDSPVRQAFNQVVLNRTAAQLRAHWARLVFTGRGRPPRSVDSGVAVKAILADDPHAIAYLAVDQLDDSVVAVAIR